MKKLFAILLVVLAIAPVAHAKSTTDLLFGGQTTQKTDYNRGISACLTTFWSGMPGGFAFQTHDEVKQAPSGEEFYSRLLAPMVESSPAWDRRMKSFLYSIRVTDMETGVKEDTFLTPEKKLWDEKFPRPTYQEFAGSTVGLKFVEFNYAVKSRVETKLNNPITFILEATRLAPHAGTVVKFEGSTLTIGVYVLFYKYDGPKLKSADDVWLAVTSIGIRRGWGKNGLPGSFTGGVETPVALPTGNTEELVRKYYQRLGNNATAAVRIEAGDRIRVHNPTMESVTIEVTVKNGQTSQYQLGAGRVQPFIDESATIAKIRVLNSNGELLTEWRR